MKDRSRVTAIFAAAKQRGREVLLETDGLALLEAFDIDVPAHLFLTGSACLADVLKSGGPRGKQVVVKVVSADIQHKSDVGGVKIVVNDAAAISAAVVGMERDFKGRHVEGYSVHEFAPYADRLGAELLVGARWTPDFGAVVTLGAGGIYAEFLASHFKPRTDIAVFSASERFDDPIRLRRQLSSLAIAPLLLDGFRGSPPLTSAEELGELLSRFATLARGLMPEHLSEIEVNPIVKSDGKWVALDVLARAALGKAEVAPLARPVHKLKNLLEPRSIALMGVSEKQINPGRVILGNILREGFDRSKLFLVKPGTEQIDGCRCFTSIAALPSKVDLLILSISAGQVPQAVTDAIEGAKAESLIIIPGGFEEKAGTGEIVARMHQALSAARQSPWQGPLLNGGNCLGVRSRPGCYDTMFIPAHKLPPSKASPSPVAVISQSGAFAISRVNKLASINPKYLVTVGNQTDLTIGDYLEYLKDDDEVRVYAAYVEGFKAGDGEKFLRAADAITREGRTVILYRAGRTRAGAAASASHTASIAGDYAVTHALSRNAGVIMAESLEDFEDLIKLFTFLDGKKPRNWRLGALSNAGFECVATADSLGRFTLASFSPATASKLARLFKTSGIDQIVDVHNPLDLTPMCNDEAFEQAARAVLEDENVDAAVIGCVPLTPALNTLANGEGHGEDVRSPDSIAHRLSRLKQQSIKPLIVTVEGGAIYDAMAEVLESNGLPVFRTIDRALRLLNIYCGSSRTK